jgi:hypothetical protein
MERDRLIDAARARAASGRRDMYFTRRARLSSDFRPLAQGRGRRPPRASRRSRHRRRIVRRANGRRGGLGLNGRPGRDPDRRVSRSEAEGRPSPSWRRPGAGRAMMSWSTSRPGAGPGLDDPLSCPRRTSPACPPSRRDDRPDNLPAPVRLSATRASPSRHTAASASSAPTSASSAPVPGAVVHKMTGLSAATGLPTAGCSASARRPTSSSSTRTVADLATYQDPHRYPPVSAGSGSRMAVLEDGAFHPCPAGRVLAP